MSKRLTIPQSLDVGLTGMSTLLAVSKLWEILNLSENIDIEIPHVETIRFPIKAAAAVVAGTSYMISKHNKYHNDNFDESDIGPMFIKSQLVGARYALAVDTITEAVTEPLMRYGINTLTFLGSSALDFYNRHRTFLREKEYEWKKSNLTINVVKDSKGKESNYRTESSYEKHQRLKRKKDRPFTQNVNIDEEKLKMHQMGIEDPDLRMNEDDLPIKIDDLNEILKNNKQKEGNN